jgi:hypothetical protein
MFEDVNKGFKYGGNKDKAHKRELLSVTLFVVPSCQHATILENNIYDVIETLKKASRVTEDTTVYGKTCVINVLTH